MILLLILLVMVSPLLGQEDLGTISGRVLLNERRPGDLSPSVQVELVAINRPGESSRATVNSEGEFRFLNVTGGGYFINAMAPGYKSVRTQIELIGGSQVRGTTKLVLLPEHPVMGNEERKDVVSQNELKAPRNAVKQVQLAERLLAEGNLAAAAPVVARALKAYPDYARALFQQGRLLEKLNKTKEPVQSYEKALEADPSY